MGIIIGVFLRSKGRRGDGTGRRTGLKIQRPQGHESSILSRGTKRLCVAFYMNEVSLGIYQHYKGKRYEVIGTVIESDTHEKMVVYRALYNSAKLGPNPIFVRPQTIFLEILNIQGNRVPRFTPVNLNLSLRFLDIFWISIFPFVIFMINYSLFVLAPRWSTKIFADDYLHFFGGASIAFSVSYILNLLDRSGMIRIKNNLLQLCVVVALVALAAVLWECFEFISDILLGTVYQPSLADTMKDMILGLLGGTFVASRFIFGKQKIGLH